ncbi:MAG: oligosaccharide flippase family protein [Ruminococcus flavefaciens]|nr:oligosaccharide flippase family protein [Ruminococcus flavefaciens]
MSNGESIKKNYFYNMLLQISGILVPLAVTPYVSRALGAEGIGEISYTQAIINYLILFANMGTGVYALRQIAYYKDDADKKKSFFSTMVYLRMFMYIPIVILFGGIVILYKEYSLLFLVEGIYILAEVINVEWYFAGNENFKITATRSILIKLLGLMLIFLFIKVPGDKYLYIFILGGLLLLGNITLFLIAFSQQGIVRPDKSQMKVYLRGSVVLFIPQVASSIYVYCDKIMIGALSSGIIENGYYEQTQKIIRLSITIITALPTVMLPKISTAYSQRRQEEIANYMIKSMKFSLFMGIPIMLGIVSVSDHLVPWFFGTEYGKVALLLKVQSPIVLFNSFYNIIGYQYFLATKQEKTFTLTILAGSICNLVLNYMLIPRWDSVGASIASVCAEVIIASIQIIILGKTVNLFSLVKYTGKAIIAGISMLLVLCFIKRFLCAGIIETFLLILTGTLVYFIIQIIFKDELLLSVLKSAQKKLCK